MAKKTKQRTARKNPGTTKTVVETTQERDKAPYWAFFFRDQRSPFLRSQMITALMEGKPFEVERLPTAALLDVVLLASTARAYHEAEIIDDFQALLRHTEEIWKSPGWTCKMFDQTHSSAADFILRGVVNFDNAEDVYIPDLVGYYLEAEAPSYIGRELV